MSSIYAVSKISYLVPWLRLFLLLILTTGSLSTVIRCEYEIEQEWEDGFMGKISVPIPSPFKFGWIILVIFSKPVVDFEIFEADSINPEMTPPNNKEYVCRNKDYNKIVYYYKDKVMHFFLEGSQYVSHDRSVFIPAPDAEALFIPRLSEEETIYDLLMRAANTPDSARYPPMEEQTSSTTTMSTTTASTASTASTTKIPWFGWVTEPVNVLTSRKTTTATTTVSSTPIPVAKKFRFNLREVIKKSLLFIEAQRSGQLPITNRIPWRSHSSLRDGMDKGVDLTGGYYVDGGHVKYGLPMASTITILSWGAIEFKRGYVAAKELGNLLGAIKWGTDYLLKCHTDTFTFFGQVSDTDTDDGTWGRPEDMRGVRPSYKITRNRPGSDLAGEASAALAAASVVLRETHPKYSRILRNHSEELYRFADRYRGKYDSSISDAAKYYRSTGYLDELAWAASWLYGITGDKKYLAQAKLRLSESIEDESPVERLDWNDKRAAVITLLAQLTNSTEYRLSLTDFCNSMLIGVDSSYTYKGLLFLDNTATSSLASNSAFICLMAANLGIRPTVFRPFAQKQLNYLLGDNGFSYMVGFGRKFPRRPYHKASSCPDRPIRCSWVNRDDASPNPQQLTGALVTGPDKWDNYVDDRNSESNRVSIYQNAGLQTAAAGVLQLQVSHETFSDPEPGELMPSINQNFDHFHDYNQVLRYSLMFYEAQRSGALPYNNRIPWRKSACTTDKGTHGEDLSGGYFDGGDFIKFNFPMAFSTTILAWGMLMYPQAYENAGESAQLRASLQWATDYFLKCHTKKNELFGQVGSVALEHSHWMRPEDINYFRPAFKITEKYPGSELAAETAAAMAATATVFQKKNITYSKLLLKHAKELHDFADKHRGVYHRSIREAGTHYPSFNGFQDELVWSSLWLYIASGETAYLTEAKAKYVQFGLGNSIPSNFYWDDKTAGVNLLLARLTKKSKYMQEAEKFCLQFRTKKYTPKGLLYQQRWGPLQYASGAALICMMTANLGIKSPENREFAKDQIHYILGDSGLGSYVVGYGPSPPVQPHHRASSCPLSPNPCNFTALYSKLENPNILYGAVVGGPDDKDQFVDERTNLRSNKVSLVYNACFQSTVAALKYLQMFPPPTAAPTSAVKPVRSSPRVIKIRRKTTTTFSPKTESGINLTNVIVNTFNETTEHGTIGDYTIQNATVTSTIPTGNVTTTQASHYTTSNYNTTLTKLNATTTQAVKSSHTTTEKESNMTVNSSTTFLSVPTLTSQVATTVGPKILVDNANGKETKYCGRQRALELFDNCVIPSVGYEEHAEKKIYPCRYTAFKACVDVQTDGCPDGVWEYWPYWNHNANDSVYFGIDDINCKDPVTIDIETCELRGMSWTFDRCYSQYKNWNRTGEKCRWIAFGNCVMGPLNHCERMWEIWKLWNMGLPPEQQFNEAEMQCYPSSAIFLNPSTTILVALTILIFGYLVRTG